MMTSLTVRSFIQLNVEIHSKHHTIDTDRRLNLLIIQTHIHVCASRIGLF